MNSWINVPDGFHLTGAGSALAHMVYGDRDFRAPIWKRTWWKAKAILTWPIWKVRCAFWKIRSVL